eukprot:CAMPEP_0198528596 /NCGR_PEP_ID=MMETSP1462-20131121/25246_1 /TAXON_ID=1333877 /ORGANISM="Brandtodinium nutriculum, Strain RCC3387" /LENGTH=113 /DNA_ID=CAMNT_0044258421 /DNA_START=281 /DNA_END=618 /DNA_ORIENTATION=-
MAFGQVLGALEGEQEAAPHGLRPRVLRREPRGGHREVPARVLALGVVGRRAVAQGPGAGVEGAVVRTDAEQALAGVPRVRRQQVVVVLPRPGVFPEVVDAVRHAAPLEADRHR